ncbi:uncharacterized protein V1516DRAFT_677348 [Lipomyces oligophaga]|uniref:uncharacterized protein n=1 Tax=Lipomyces oligophaga TaxID=45792 RepID=UPI0034CEA625
MSMTSPQNTDLPLAGTWTEPDVDHVGTSQSRIPVSDLTKPVEETVGGVDLSQKDSFNSQDGLQDSTGTELLETDQADGKQPDDTSSIVPDSDSRPADPASVSSQKTTSSQIRGIPPVEESSFNMKKIKWLDPQRQSRQDSIILQNENGPCPLIALVNTLILSTSKTVQTPLSQLSTRDEINASYLIDLLAELLLTKDITGAAGDDITSVLSLLPSLHTGLNVNPRFDGTFEPSPELALFRVFDVDLVHGWISDPDNRYFDKAVNSAMSYEGSQSLLIQASEVTSKLGTQASLTAEELEVVENARIIEIFLERTATQMTAFGIKFLNELLSPGSFAVLFRNDHFSTVYKHPDTKQLFMLVTDAGFAQHSAIVWESLNDVSGSASLFFNGLGVPAKLSGSVGDDQLAIANSLAEASTISCHNDVSVSTSQTAKTDNTDSDTYYSTPDLDHALAMELQSAEDAAYARQQQEAEDRAERRRRERATKAAATNTRVAGSSKNNRGAHGAPRSGNRANTSLYGPYGQEATNLLTEMQGSSSTRNASVTVRDKRAATASRKEKEKEKEKCRIM